MGSFNISCALSGLPCTPGDPVRWLPLNQNPYGSRPVYIYDRWVPRAWPIHAKYDDYGNVDGFKDTDLAVRAFEEVLKVDLKPVGAGSNPYHDPPTAPGIKMAAIMDAIHEGRLMTVREVSFDATLFRAPADAEERALREADAKGVPTLASVTRALKEAKLKVYDPNDPKRSGDKKGMFRVDERDHGWMVVHPTGYPEDYGAALEPARKALESEFAVMITRAKNVPSREGAELQVMPKHTGPSCLFLDGGNRRPDPLLDVAVIREDVWRAFADSPVETDYGRASRSRSATLEMVRDVWVQLMKEPNHRRMLTMQFYPGSKTREDFEKSWVASHFLKSSIPFSMGLGEHSLWTVLEHAKTPYSDEEIEQWLGDVADLFHITSHMMCTNQLWMPSHYAGQEHFFQHQAHRFGVLETIAQQLAHEDAQEQARFDAEMAAAEAADADDAEDEA